MTDNNQKIWEAIASMLGGNPSVKDQQIFNAWINENEGNRKFYETILHSKHNEELFTPEAKKRVYKKINAYIQSTSESRKINLWAYAAVASIAVFLTLAISLIFLSPKNNDKVSYLEAKTPFGVKSKISLPDGSVVYLNAGSTFNYPANFSDKQRLVMLQGEAYFEVAKDPNHPFIIETGNLKVKVLGTHFNVKNYTDDDNIEVSLLEGSVEVLTTQGEGKQNKTILIPNQEALYNKKSKEIHKHGVDAVLSAIWKDGKYYFENERFSAIAAKLERNFNVKIKIESDDLNKQVFSGLFDRNKSIFQMLDVIKNYCHFDYTVRNDTIVIKTIY